jgi:hypothetical protein
LKALWTSAQSLTFETRIFRLPPQAIRKNIGVASSFAYDKGEGVLDVIKPRDDIAAKSCSPTLMRASARVILRETKVIVG